MNSKARSSSPGSNSARNSLQNPAPPAIQEVISNTTPSLFISELDPAWKKTRAGKLEIGWLKILKNWRQDTRVREAIKIKELARRGIPQNLRKDVWLKLAGAELYKAKYAKSYYQGLLAKDPIGIYDVIERDVHRCYPSHPKFAEKNGKGQAQLRNVLRAYSQFHPEVGYCQGMGMLAGGFLMLMPEEDAFWLLVAVIDRYLEGYYEPSMLQIRIDSAAFQALIGSKVSRSLEKRLKQQGVEALMFTTQWFLVLYTLALPLPTVMRIWDVFFSEGTKVLFRVGLALLKQANPVLQSKCPSIAETMQYLLHMPQAEIETNSLLRTAFKIQLSRNLIKKLQIEQTCKLYQAKKTDPIVQKVATGTYIKSLQ